MLTTRLTPVTVDRSGILPIWADSSWVSNGAPVDLSSRIGLVNRETLYVTNSGEAITLSLQEVSRECVTSATILRRILQLGAGASISRIEQVVSVRDSPVYFRVGYHPPNFDPEQLTRTAGDLHRTAAAPIAVAFERLFGMPYGSTEVHIGAVRASNVVADRLRVAAQSAVMLREVLVSSIDGVPCSLSFAYYRSDKVTIVDSVKATPRT